MKKLLKRTIIYRFLKEKGMLNNEYRRFLFINFIFQRIFSLNRECPWSVNFTSTVIAARNIRIGHNVKKSFTVSGNCYFQAINGIQIGDNTIFASGIKIISSDHDFIDTSKHIKNNGIKIGKNCWIGANAVILPGVSIADNVIVGAGSIVTKSITDEYSIVVGNPAKVIRKINV